MKYTFEIDDKLPSLNEVISANRSNPYRGAKLKKEVQGLIGIYIRQAKIRNHLRHIEKPVIVDIEWHERTKKRDADNIQSSQKFILDALVECGILTDDSRQYVKQINHVIMDDKRNRVIVTLREIE